MNNYGLSESPQANSGSLPIRPRARLVETLGAELISSETVAILELVKNSFDADATQVRLSFLEPLDADDGCIEVADNGNGMSAEDFLRSWMEIATPNKKQNQYSEFFNRRVLGEKGVGRFASSRLAGHLELISRKRGSFEETLSNISWDEFSRDDLFLDEVSIPWLIRTPIEIVSGFLDPSDGDTPQQNDVHGTILRLTKLRSIWNRQNLSELRNLLARLILPFDAGLPERSKFQITLAIEGEYSDLSGDVVPSDATQDFHYSLEGLVDQEGNYDVLLKLRGRDDLPLTGTLKLHHDGRFACGPFWIAIRVWDRDALDEFAKKYGKNLRSFREDLDQVAGINIYRDGFRVLPYGEPKDDWIRLDARRVNNPTLRLSNNQIVGYVSVTAKENPELRDQSNREGLIDGDAYRDLRGAVTQLLSLLEARRYEIRQTERLSRRPRRPQTGSLFEGFSLNAVRAVVESQPTNVHALREAVEKAEGDLAERVVAVQEVLSRYRKLATLGQLIDTVLHEGRAPLGKIDRLASIGVLQADDAKREDFAVRRTARAHFEDIRSLCKSLSQVFRKIEPLGGRKRGYPRLLTIEEVLGQAVSLFDADIERLNVTIDMPSTRTEVRAESTEMLQVFANLLQNSLYWLSTSREKREIQFSVAVVEGKTEVTICDTGPGVSADVRDLIFDSYFSTKPDGLGLGLSIAGEILSEYYDGSLELVESEKGACFRSTLKGRS